MNAGLSAAAPRVIALSVATLLLAACATPAPVHYYTLVAPLAVPVQNADFDINVLPVSVPPGMAQPAMVLRIGQARLMVQDDHQWAAPLPQALQAALSDDLTASLGTRDLADVSAPGHKPVYGIKLVVRHFDVVYGGHVAIDALWSVQQSDGNVVLTCSSNANVPVKTGYTALARGAQQALSNIATAIGSTLRALPDASCPVTG